MNDISDDDETRREILFNRREKRNHIFSVLVGYYARLAEQGQINKRMIATRLGIDPSRVTNVLREPSNLTIDTISDLLWAMNADMAFSVFPAEGEQSDAEFMDEFSGWATRKVDALSIGDDGTMTTPASAAIDIGEIRGETAT